MKRIVFGMMLALWAGIVMLLTNGCAGQKKVIESQAIEAKAESTPEWTDSRMHRSIEEPVQDKNYTVIKHDCLWKIAGKVYDDALDWPVIYKANRDKIKNPHWIYPKQVFLIPQLP